ncbi:hypothetical protein [Lignipirellula cremea]|uniref:Uncharacterized protein n=1 Tax=Lignipirellula cremea TaxID=2528010 RepID=A0A518DUP5_9BACT|nr:hypothetical protein [Lignipirellula cremea]QDU95562.1 hypothetical protein Pla8534_33780 [Lignipirellula cremea]
MSKRCVALLSGGLDSMLAIRLMQEQGIEVEALNFKTLFTCCQDQSAQAAHDLGVRLTVVSQDDDYLELLRKPEYGYGKGANPCVDCRIYMFDKAKRFMEQIDAGFIISGEVVGQRPMSQKRTDLEVIAHHSHLDDLLLRPLSARVLHPTLPEREGWVDREKLYGFVGRSRKELIALGKKLGLRSLPTPSTGCALTEPLFSQKVFDLIQIQPQARRWDYEVLRQGRHFRFDAETKVMVGRNEAENDALKYAHQLPDAASTAYLYPANFLGPFALVAGRASEKAVAFAAGLLLKYGKFEGPGEPLVEVVQRDQPSRQVVAAVSDAVETARTLGSEPTSRRSQQPI